VAASIAPARSPSRCSRSFATSIQASVPIAPRFAAMPTHAASASPKRPSRRSSRARSASIRASVHGASRRLGVAASHAPAAGYLPACPPKSGARRGDHHGSSSARSRMERVAARTAAGTKVSGCITAGGGAGRASSAASRQPSASACRPSRE
jgi:hypothetical protein